MSRALLGVLALVVVTASGVVAQTRLVGTWQGTSTCADKVAFPACNDEVVIYVIQPVGARADSITVKADKIVNGAREYMGDLQFGRAGEGTWEAEIQTARYHDRWTLTVEGDHITGTLVDLPSGRLVRNVSLRRALDSP